MRCARPREKVFAIARHKHGIFIQYILSLFNFLSVSLYSLNHFILLVFFLFLYLLSRMQTEPNSLTFFSQLALSKLQKPFWIVIIKIVTLFCFFLRKKLSTECSESVSTTKKSYLVLSYLRKVKEQKEYAIIYYCLFQQIYLKSF